jgi:hypothetical protein
VLAWEVASKAVGEIAQGRDPAGEKQAAKVVARVSNNHDLVEKVAE